MSRHEGVSCDSCLRGNFRGKRFKCLICYDYDLCATCYEAGASTTRHNADHPMQCILTRSDFDLYYAGEALIVEQPQAYSCPFCGKMGYTEASLQEHVTADHSDSSLEVVCPICASLPGGEANNITDDFASHLTLEHRSSREMEEPSGSRHIRRIPHPGRGIASAARARRAQMQFTSSSALSALSPGGNRESMDPISELLSQLSGVRRTINLAQSTTSQLQQLQLQLERQQAQAARQQLERLPRRQGQISNNSATTANSTLAVTTATTSTAALATSIAMANSVSLQSQYAHILESFPSPSSSSSGSKFLLSRCTDTIHSENELQRIEREIADRILFIEELLLCALTEDLNLLKLDSCDAVSHVFDSSIPETTGHQANAGKKEAPVLPSKVISPGVMSPSATIPPQHQWTPQTHQTGNSHHHSQSSRNVAARKSNSSSVRHSGRNRGGSSGGSNHPQPPRELGLPSARGGSTSYIQQVSPRDSLASNRHVARATGRETGPSPSATRRKVLRQVDDRNKYTDPPPH